jgi:hypothetical protein
VEDIMRPRISALAALMLCASVSSLSGAQAPKKKETQAELQKEAKMTMKDARALAEKTAKAQQALAPG